MRHLLAFLFIASLLTSCKKQTTVYGRITSSAGGVPIEGADISLKFYFTGDGNVSKVVGSDFQKTGTSGQYVLEAKPSQKVEGYVTVQKEGFAPTNFETVSFGDNIELDFVLNPYDAYLSINFENPSPSEVKKYLYFCNSDFLTQGFNHWDKAITLQPLETKTELHLIPGGSPIKLTWDTVRITGKPLKHLVIIPCERNITNYYTVKVE